MQALCDLLGEQKSLLENMLTLAHEERRIIVSGEAENLEAIVRQELKELSKLGAVEKKRIALQEAISKALGMPMSEINVTSIAKRASSSEREAIQKLQGELTLLIDEHTVLNAENRDLINAHLEYTEIMLNIMVDSEDPLNNFYGDDGKATTDRKKTTGIFDGHA